MSILEALGISEFPAPDSLSKLLKDHLVCQRVQELLVEELAARVIHQMHPLERQTLLKRIAPPAQPAAPVYKVNWKVEGGLISGKPMLMGSCTRCQQTCHYDGKPDGAQGVVWSHCSLGPSKATPETIEEYKARFNYLM